MNFRTKPKHSARNALRSILDAIRIHGPSDTRYGICSSIAFYRMEMDYEYINSEDLMRPLREAFATFGLSHDYPVVHPEYDNSQAAFNNVDHLWDRKTVYGQRRWELLDALITYFDDGKVPEISWRFE